MSASLRNACVAVLIAVLAGSAAVCPVSAAAPIRTGQMRVWSAGHRVEMPVTLYLPFGRGPFRLAIINHGTSSNAQLRSEQELSPYSRIGRWFASRGFIAAVPQRPGHGLTGGAWLEDYGSCADPHYYEAGLAAAREIAAVLDALLTRPDVRRDGIVLLGHSAGGWASLALASRNPPGLAAVVDFAGGLGGRSYDVANTNCAPERLVEAAGRYGASVRIPTLWIYAADDTYFDPALATQMAAAFVRAGGSADLRILDQPGLGGHFLLFDPAAEPVVSRLLDGFLHAGRPKRDQNRPPASR